MARNLKTSQRTQLFPRAVPQMPEGYYSGDKPNPHLRAFVEAHLAAHPYDPATDDYDVPAFNQPIETTKATAIYNMHTYWSKKPHDAIREYIRHYTEPGDLVLDPMCGSGGTALAALMEGRTAIAIDRSPAATFITKNYCTPVDVDALREAFEQLKARVKPEIGWLYATRCDRCGGPAITGYTVYSQVFQCPRCLEKVPLFDCAEVKGHTKDGKPKTLSACPYCHARGITEEINTRAEKFGAVPVLVRYECENGCKPARDERRHNDRDPQKREYFEKYDLGKLHEIEARPIPHWYPTDRMMHAPEDQERWGEKWRAGTSNFRTVDELFTKRNVWVLAVVRNAIMDISDSDIRDVLLFALTGILFNCSKMYRERDEGRGAAKGNYYMPPLAREMVVTNGMYYKVEEQLIPAYEDLQTMLRPSLCISTESACELSAIATSSIDYILTDPPYGSNVQYGELNFVWEAWLGLDTRWQDEEIIVNEVRGKSEADWANMMREAMAECYRVLKPGRWLSLCYHDTSTGTWALIQDIMAEAGFIVDSSSNEALFIDTGQKSYNQLTADKVNKRDLVINFRKPRPGEVHAEVTISGDEDERTFGEKVRAIIRDYLTAHPGSTKDRVYDEVVSRMVRAGQMEAHDFDALLEQVAEEAREPVRRNLFENEPPNLFGTHEVGRWYLKETAEADVVDAAESAKEDAAAAKLRAFITNYLKRHPHAEGVHYSDLFEQYIYAVKDKPRRQLADWLPDYFYKTDEGTWRLPANAEEERLKVEGREKGTNRRIKRYLAYLQQGVAVPAKERPSDATLAEWIRACKRAGLYEQGKQLYEKGGLRLERLSEEAQVNAEEDYQVCVRMLARVGASGGASASSRKG